MDAKLYITEIINELTFVKDSIREDDCTKLIALFSKASAFSAMAWDAPVFL